MVPSTISICELGRIILDGAFLGQRVGACVRACVCVHSVHASVVQESARFYCHTKRWLVKSEGTSVKVGQGVSHHMTCGRLLTNVSLLLAHACKHTLLHAQIQGYSVT